MLVRDGSGFVYAARLPTRDRCALRGCSVPVKTERVLLDGRGRPHRVLLCRKHLRCF